MNAKGFYLFKGALGCTFMEASEVEVLDVVRSPKDDILDLIFSQDPRTGFPTGALEAYMSDSTNIEVREYLDKVLFKELPDNLPTGDLLQFLKDDVDTDFLAKVSRNQFESNEDYMERLQSYFDELEKDKQLKKKLNDWNEKIAQASAAQSS